MKPRSDNQIVHREGRGRIFPPMAENDLLKRLLDAGMTFTAMTQARAEDLIRDLVRAGEVQAEQAQSVIDELVDRSRRNSERLIDAVRAEIRQQMASLGLATTGDVERLERKIADISAAQGARKATTRKAAARRATTKTTARKAGGRTAGGRTAGAKKAGAKKASAKKASAKKASAKKATKVAKAPRSSKASKTSKASRARSTR
jgi:polyhydroxyalkanoate synthesis regulator phasin